MEYPKHVEDILIKASEKSGMPIENLRAKYNEYYASTLHDESFLDDEGRHQYCARVLWNNFGFRTPMSPHDIVPLGFSTPQNTKNGRQATLFAFDIAKQKMVPVVVKERKIDDLKTISIGSIYKQVDLGENKDSSAYFCDDRTEFKNPLFEDGLLSKLMDFLKFPKVKLSEASSNLSRKDSSGYVDKLDWRCIDGFIYGDPVTKTDGVDKKGNPSFYGRCIVNDDSILTGVPVIRKNEDGTIEVRSSPGITVWLNPWIALKFPKDSQCFFFGTLEANENKEVSMRCYSVILKHGPKKEA